MKTIKKLVIGLISAAMIFACETPQDEVFYELETQDEITAKKLGNGRSNVIPFSAKFVTSLTPTDEAGDCEAPFSLFNNQEGEGKAGRFGNFSTKITFCVNLQTLEYVDGEGTFIMENGDELYFTIAGQIKPSDHPNYNLEFQDPFTFTGGTGQFEGASGGGITNSFVQLFPEGGDETDHRWKGTLILPEKPGKRSI